MVAVLNAHVPAGPLEEKWERHKFDMKLVSPANKRKYTIIVVGTGLAGASAAATLSELGYRVIASRITIRRAARTASPRRAASTPPRTTRTTATPSIGCSTTRSRAATSARARRTSTGSPRSASTSSTSAWRRACRSRANTAGCSRTGRSAARRSRGPSMRAARLASNCCSAHIRRSSGRSAAALVEMRTHTEMLDLVVVDGRARGIVTRDLVTGAGPVHSPAMRSCWRPAATATSSTSRRTHATRTPRRSGARTSAARRSPTRASRRSIPTCIPVSGEYQSKLTLMSESLRNDGRVWVPTRGAIPRSPERDSRTRSATTSWSGSIRASATWRRATSRRAPRSRSAMRGVGSVPAGLGVYLDFRDAIQRLGRERHRRALRQPVRDVPAHHRRRPVSRADADLPGGALHDGRTCGWTTIS